MLDTDTVSFALRGEGNVALHLRQHRRHVNWMCKRSIMCVIRGEVRLAGCQIDRHGDMFKHDQPVASTIRWNLFRRSESHPEGERPDETNDDVADPRGFLLLVRRPCRHPVQAASGGL